MEIKKGFKYRFGGEFFERDLTSLEENCFWAPNYIKLNDPCETLVFSDDIKLQAKLFANLFGVKEKGLEPFNIALEQLLERKTKLGIYSLSTSYSHELLWAHYANSHKGFCIEYNLDTLIDKNIYHKFHFLSVVYSNSPPAIEAKDVSRNTDQIIQKLAATKSKAWDYEKEIRIITDTLGENYYDYSAVTKIYFGFRMEPKERDVLMKRLRGRGIEFYEIILEKKSYKFIAKPVTDKYKDSIPYLFEIGENDHKFNYEILSKTYDSYNRKGIIHIRLPRTILKKELEILAKDLKVKLFKNADKVFMFYLPPKMKKDSGAWATSHFEKGKFDISIKGMSLKTEERFITEIKNETRKIMIAWLDYEQYASSKIILYEDKSEYILETSRQDGVKTKEKLLLVDMNKSRKYCSLEKNKHGEYMEISEKHTLEFYSTDGKYKEIEPLGLSYNGK